MEIGKQVVSSLRWMAISRFSGQLITWVVTITVMRILSPSDYGLMAMATAVTGLTMLLNGMGMGAALVQKQELDQQSIAQVFGLLILFNATLYLLLFVSAPPIAHFFAEPRLVSMLRVISLEFLIMPVTSLAHAVLSRKMGFKKIALVELVRMLTASLVTLALALTGHGVWSLIIGNLMGVIAAAIGFSIAARHLCWPNFSPRGMRSFMGFGGLVALNRVLWFIFTQIDVFLIGKILGKEQLGFYSVAKHLASLPAAKISGMLNDVSFAAFSRIQHDQEQVRKHLCKAVQLLSFCLFPVFFGISAVTPELVGVLLGEKWHQAIIPLQLLSLVMPLRMLTGLLPPVLMGVGRPEVNVSNLFIGCLIMPISLLIGMQWGLLGACLSWVVVYPFYFLMVLKRSLPVLGLRINDYLAVIRPAVLAAVVMYLTVLGFRQVVTANLFTATMDLAILVMAGVFIYGLLVFLTQKDTFSELIAQIKR